MYTYRTDSLIGLRGIQGHSVGQELAWGHLLSFGRNSPYSSALGRRTIWRPTPFVRQTSSRLNEVRPGPPTNVWEQNGSISSDVRFAMRQQLWGVTDAKAAETVRLSTTNHTYNMTGSGARVVNCDLSISRLTVASRVRGPLQRHFFFWLGRSSAG